jgi:hypothetical protein
MRNFNLEEILSRKNNVYKFTTNPDVATKKLVVIFVGTGFTEHVTVLYNTDINVFDHLESVEKHSNTSATHFYKNLISEEHQNHFDHLFLSDPSKSQYFEGVPGITNNVEETRDFLLKLIQTKEYTDVHFIGTTASAYQGFLQACLIKKYINENNLTTTLTNISVLGFNTKLNANNDILYRLSLKNEYTTVNGDYSKIADVFTTLNNSITPKFSAILYTAEESEYVNELEEISNHDLFTSAIIHNSINCDKIKNVAKWLNQNSQLGEIIGNFIRTID